MKKYNIGFVFLQIAIILLTSWLISFALYNVSEGEPPFYFTFIIMVFPLMFWPLLYFPLINHILSPIAKRTIRKQSADLGFEDAFTYTNKNTGTVGSITKIDIKGGRIGYVSFQNPFKFQVVPASEIKYLKADLIKGPFGGTRYVYFLFICRNKKTMIPTFTSRNMYSIGSTKVQDALAKANKVCGIIHAAKLASLAKAGVVPQQLDQQGPASQEGAGS